jgi:ElaB/YqjD/DUF883 family membrane-anchored ribosome-binding protein
VSAKLGNLIAQQVERSKAKEAVVVQFAATLPSDGSLVNLDWWQRQINGLLAPIGIDMEFADLDTKPAAKVGQVSPIQVVQMQRKMAEMQLLIDDLEKNLHEKAAQLAKTMAAEIVTQPAAALTRRETALRAVEQDGFYLDEQGQRWVSIEAEAKRIGKPYITVWRACKGIGIHKAEAWVVGETQAGGERLLIKQGSFSEGKRRKKGTKP